MYTEELFKLAHSWNKYTFKQEVSKNDVDRLYCNSPIYDPEDGHEHKTIGKIPSHDESNLDEHFGRKHGSLSAPN